MAIKVRSFWSTGRYYFDFEKCKGWSQVDTKQDASYFGTWACPLTLRILSYTEGDICETICESVDDFCNEMNDLILWNEKHDYWKGIDTLCKDHITAKWIELGYRSELY